MSIPMEAVTVKFPPCDIPNVRKQAEFRGFEGISDYLRHLAVLDHELLHKQWLALTPIFEPEDGSGKTNEVSRGVTREHT